MIDKYKILNLFKRLFNNKFFKYFNFVVSVVSLFYISNILSDQINYILELNYLALLISVIIYICGIFFLALGWSFLNNGQGLKNNIYLKSWYYSILGKYVPFKITPALLRYNYLKINNHEINLPTYSKLTVKEQIFIIFTASLFSIFFFLDNNLLNNFILLNIFLVLYTTFLIFKNKKVLICYVGFYYLSFLSLLSFNILSYGELLTSSVFAFILSSLIAFFAIGSPAGIGIREYVSVLLLSNNFSEEFILVLFMQYRIITMISDFLSFLIFKIYRKLSIWLE